MKVSSVFFTALALGVALACGTQVADVPPEPSRPTAPDGGPTPADAATDMTAVDTGATDATKDAPADARADSGPDATTDATTDGGADAGVLRPLVFSAMGDVPYTAADGPTLQAQIVQHNALSPSRFMVHLGDIKSGSTPCVEATYRTVASYLHALAVPTFVIPGDNEWNDCADPDEAWGFWTRHFGRFESFWPAAPAVARQAVRTENFAWMDSGVLLVGINLVGGRVHSAPEWATRHAQNVTWITDQLALHGAAAYAMVLFAHADPTASHNAFMVPYRAAVGAWGKPVLHLMGDGHTWKMDRPWPEQNILRVEVEQGGRAQPIQVTVTPLTPDPFTIARTPY